MTLKALSRGIKFRCWNKLENKFISLEDFDMTIRQDGMVVSFGSNNDGDGYFNLYEKPYPHIELMQYTGLLDKNGKEIYEGDIVKTEIGTTLEEWRHEENLEVVFKLGSYCIVNERRSATLKSHIDEVLKLSVEIIGNIYESPELLTKENE